MSVQQPTQQDTDDISEDELNPIDEAQEADAAGEGVDDSRDDVSEFIEGKFPTRIRSIHHADAFMETIDLQLLAGRPYRVTQREAALYFHQWMQTGLERPDLRGSVVKPMGTGKTGFAIIMSEMVGGKVLFVADTNANAEQAAQEYEAHYTTLPDEKSRTVGRYYGPHQQHTSDIVISGFWMEEKWMSNLDWSQMSLVVIDEADINGLSPKRAAFIRKIATEYGIPVVGTSATEEQMSGKKLRDVFPDDIYRLPMPTALPMCRKLGLIPHTNFHDLFFEGTLEIDREMLQRKGDIEHSVIRQFTKSNAWNKQIIDHYLRDGNKPQGLVVFRTNEQVDDFIKEAKKRKIRAMRFTGEESVEELQEIRQAFEKGKVDLLVGSRLLGRGLNLPKIRVIYNSTLTYSPQMFWQVNGRALRNEEDDLMSHRDVYAILPKSVKDIHTGTAVYAEEVPLTNSAFFSRSFFPDEMFLTERKVAHLENRTFDIDKLPIIRGISQVMELVKGRRAKPEGFESRATQSAKLLNGLRETKMDIRICIMLKRMTSDRRIKIIQCLEALDSDASGMKSEKKIVDPLNIIAGFSLELGLREEMGLVLEMRKGIPLKGGSSHTITPEVAQKSYRAREVLFRAHLKLISACANMFVDSQHDYDELFQVASEKFLEALDATEFGRGRIMNFAIFRLYQGLSRHVEKMEKGRNEHERFREGKDQIWLPERELFANEEVTPFDYAGEMEIKATFDKIFAGLGEQRETIMRMFYGMNEDEKEYTHEEAGERFGVTGTRVSQIKMSVLRNLRGHKIGPRIKPYWGEEWRHSPEREPTLAEEINKQRAIKLENDTLERVGSRCKEEFMNLMNGILSMDFNFFSSRNLPQKFSEYCLMVSGEDEQSKIRVVTGALYEIKWCLKDMQNPTYWNSAHLNQKIESEVKKIRDVL